jgi:hypothetical protein
MSSRQFQNYYGINLNTNDGRWEAALAMAQRPAASEFSSYMAPALGAKGIVFGNEAWLTVTIKPAVYAGGLEAENQIAMGLTVAINISLGILKKDYLGALSIRNNLTQGESLPVLQAGLSGVDINVMEGYFIAWEGGMFKEEQRIEKLLKSNASNGQRHFLKNGLKNVRALGAAAGAIGVGLSWYEASQKDTAGAYSLATVDTIMVGVGIFFPVICITYGLVRFGLDIAGVDLAGGIDTGINYFLGN